MWHSKQTNSSRGIQIIDETLEGKEEGKQRAIRTFLLF